MKPHVALLCTALGGLLIAGCASAPTPAPKTPPPKPVAAPAAPAAAVTPAAAPAAPAAETTPAESAAPVAEAAPAPLTPEAQAVVEKFTQPGSGAMPHTVAGNTGFPAAMASLQPGAVAPAVSADAGARMPTRGLTADGSTVDLVDKDWTGLVLVPVDKAFAKLHFAGIQILAIEAHPLTDGRVRVWVRLRNKIQGDVPAQVACTFCLRGAPEPGGARFYSLPVPGGQTRDVFFVSPAGDLDKYIVLVRTTDMTQ